MSACYTAHIVLKSGPEDPKSLLRMVKKKARETMSVYMQPRSYETHDSLPRNPNGKIDYMRLKG